MAAITKNLNFSLLYPAYVPISFVFQDLSNFLEEKLFPSVKLEENLGRGQRKRKSKQSESHVSADQTGNDVITEVRKGRRLKRRRLVDVENNCHINEGLDQVYKSELLKGH